jgi:predicted tellurium resistance membrane protein TerC
MSLDNVIAVAAAAGDSTTLLILGLAISIPLVIFGSTLLIKVMERFPIVITVGAALIGFVAGEMVVTDPALGDWMSANFQMVDKKPMLAGFHLEVIVGLAGALLVVLVGKLLARRQTAAVGESQEIPR